MSFKHLFEPWFCVMTIWMPSQDQVLCARVDVCHQKFLGNMLQQLVSTRHVTTQVLGYQNRQYSWGCTWRFSHDSAVMLQWWYLKIFFTLMDLRAGCAKLMLLCWEFHNDWALLRCKLGCLLPIRRCIGLWSWWKRYQKELVVCPLETPKMGMTILQVKWWLLLCFFFRFS